MNELTMLSVVLSVVGYVAAFALGGFVATVVGSNSIARLYGQSRAALNEAQAELLRARMMSEEIRGLTNGLGHDQSTARHA